MKFLVTLLLFCQMFYIHNITFAQNIQEDYEKAKLIYLSSTVCSSTYSDRFSQMMLHIQEEYDLSPKAFLINNKFLDTTFVVSHLNSTLSTDKDVFIVAFRGSENKKDWDINLSAEQVVFRGKDNLREITAATPKVHKGFNDYVDIALKQTTNDNELFTNVLLQKDTKSDILLTGHSLGGAVATLYAARLIEKGVDPARITVITFGAPAVGNKAFATEFTDKINLIRVVADGDIVPSSLQRFVSGQYSQFGEELIIKGNLRKQDFKDMHKMSFYLNGSIKNYYDKKQALNIEEDNEKRIAGLPVVAVYQSSTDKAKKSSSYPYMQKLLSDQFRHCLPGYIFMSTKDNDNLNKIIKDAQSLKADYLLITKLDTIRMFNLKDKRSLILSYMLVELKTGATLQLGSYSSTLGAQNAILQTLVQDTFNICQALKEVFPESMLPAHSITDIIQEKK